jgi:uncharacterized protein (UPF0548 family)
LDNTVIPMASWTARSLPMDTRKAYWESQPSTAGLEDRRGKHDQYSIRINPDSADPDNADPEKAAASPDLFELAAASLLRYEVYPPRQMRALVCSPDKKAHIGTLILQRIIFGPFAIEAAVRVVEMIEPGDAGLVAGFSYVTLRGHAEKGLATFSVSRRNGEVVFRIESWSVPAKGLAKLLAPFSRMLQKKISLQALAHFRREISVAIEPSPTL